MRGQNKKEANMDCGHKRTVGEVQQGCKERRGTKGVTYEDEDLIIEAELCQSRQLHRTP